MTHSLFLEQWNDTFSIPLLRSLYVLFSLLNPCHLPFFYLKIKLSLFLILNCMALCKITFVYVINLYSIIFFLRILSNIRDFFQTIQDGDFYKHFYFPPGEPFHVHDRSSYIHISLCCHKVHDEER